MSTPSSRVTSVGVMWPRSSRTGTVSLKVPCPVRRSTSQTALSWARYSQNSLMPPSKRKVSSLLPSPVQVPLVADDEGQAGHEEGGLAGALVERLQGELGVLEEDLPVRPVPHAGAGAGLGDPLALAQAVGRVEGGVRARLGEDAGDAAPEADRVGRAAAVDLDVEAGGQGVDHGGADAVQTAGGRVRAAAELAAGVQLGHDDLDAGQAGLGLDVDRDAAAVVPDLDGAVVVEDHLDVVAVAAQGLVDGVVDDLPEAVHEAAAVGGPDVHAGALADRLEPFEDEQVPRGVVGAVTVCSGQQRSGRHGRFGGHAVRSSLNFSCGPVGYRARRRSPVRGYRGLVEPM